jgi:uncharacterized repeat protein (TIGR01451 family)
MTGRRIPVQKQEGPRAMHMEMNGMAAGYRRGGSLATRAGVWAAGLLASAALLAAAPAAAEVVLKTSVVKVESLLDPAGRLRRQLVPADQVVAGEELRYTITFTNDSGEVVERDRIVITNALPDGTRYVTGSAGGDGAEVRYSVDGEGFDDREPQGATAEGAGPDEVRVLRWTYRRALAPGESGEIYFHVRML